MIGTQRITTDAELDRAIKSVNELVDRGFDDLTSEQDHLLRVLTDQIEAYEADRYPDEPIPQARMLRSLLDNKGLTPSELAAEAGTDESTILSVLSGSRTLSEPEKAAIARVFCVGPGVFD